MCSKKYRFKDRRLEAGMAAKDKGWESENNLSKQTQNLWKWGNNMKKRIVSFVLIITMLVAFVPFSDLNFTVNAASSDRDSYKSTYGVSYEELFRKYPIFLELGLPNDYYRFLLLRQ